MSLFSGISGSISGAVTNAATLAVNNVVDSAAQKANEAASKVIGTIGDAGNFKKLSADAVSIAESAKGKALEAFGAGTGQIPEIGKLTDRIGGTALDKAGAAAALAPDAGVSPTASQYKSEVGIQPDDTEHIIKLALQGNEGEHPDSTEIIFKIMPDIVENRNVDYEAVAPAQSPSAFQKYKGTQPTQWTINATFVCRTTGEATQNLNYINTLRGWTMPYFGVKTGQRYLSKLGAPPPVLILSGYRGRMIGPVPVVMTGLNWNFPQDVDYIPATDIYGGKVIPFPTVMKVSINLVESWSTEQMNGFDLHAFRTGDYTAALEPLSKQDETVQPTQTPDDPSSEPTQEVQRGGRSAGFAYSDPRRTDLQNQVGGGRGYVNPSLDTVISERKTVDDSWRGRGERGVRWTMKR